MCVLLRVGAIKHSICWLPLAPNAQRENLTLTSNPLTRKRTNALGVYVALHLTNKSISMCIHWTVQYQWETCQWESLLTCSCRLPPSAQPDGLPLTEHWHQMCSSRVDLGTSWAECASGSVNENGCAECVCVRVLFTVVQWDVTVWEPSVGEVFFFFSFLFFVFSEWATASCAAAQFSHAAHNSTPPPCLENKAAHLQQTHSTYCTEILCF